LRKNEEEISILLTHLYRDMSRAISQNAGLSFSRLLVFHELMHEGELSQAELQKRLGMEGALVTRFVKQMEKDGLVSRRADPNDNRYTLVALTQKGREAMEKLESLRSKSENELLKGVGKKEKAVLVSALNKIQENISRWQTRKTA
jgi:DNA-binding MarR family transcriptional regulator